MDMSTYYSVRVIFAIALGKMEKESKSGKGCIVDVNPSYPNLVIVNKGEKDLWGLIDITVSPLLELKRASRICKLSNSSMEDDVQQNIQTH